MRTCLPLVIVVGRHVAEECAVVVRDPQHLVGDDGCGLKCVCHDLVPLAGLDRRRLFCAFRQAIRALVLLGSGIPLLAPPAFPVSTGAGAFASFGFGFGLFASRALGQLQLELCDSSAGLNGGHAGDGLGFDRVPGSARYSMSAAGSSPENRVGGRLVAAAIRQPRTHRPGRWQADRTSLDPKTATASQPLFGGARSRRSAALLSARSFWRAGRLASAVPREVLVLRAIGLLVLICTLNRSGL